ncbi:hypothetical protein HY382_01695 [Candidatus Curtissbacteria bacterium]|nr:hypothetical protein [Candidatus Curtissbacteria bacterium]
MSTKIETGEQGIQLNLREATTVIIIPKARGFDRRNQTAPSDTREVVESELIRRTVQDFIDFGPEDIDQGIGLSRLEKKLRLAKQVFTFEDFKCFLKSEIDEIGQDLEGAKAGSISSVLTTASNFIIDKAEEIWSDPN